MRRPPATGFENWPISRAVVQCEDHRHWQHKGIDPRAVVRAIARNLSGVRQGGSTIAQQLSRRTMRWYDTTYERKLSESVAALSLTRSIPKRSILWSYLTTAYFGYGIYGIHKASDYVFGKLPDALSITEGAQLAAALRYPYMKTDKPEWQEKRAARAKRIALCIG